MKKYFIIFLLFFISTITCQYTMVTNLDGFYFLSGKNSLTKLKLMSGKLTQIAEVNHIEINVPKLHGTDSGLYFEDIIAEKSYRVNRNYSMDNCLSWLQEHPNAKKRENSTLDYTHWKYHTPNGDWHEMNEFCMNTYIKGILNYDDKHYWVCGTFGAFPKAFLIEKESMNFVKFIDTNFASCSRYIDEPMALHKSSYTKEIFVGSGFGLYRPARKNPDAARNNSTMLYSNWMMYREMNTITNNMNFVLSSDVNFIHVVKETKYHLYFFGREISHQYSMTNQENRHAWQSFLVRICKSDLGYKFLYTSNEQYIWGYEANQDLCCPKRLHLAPMIHQETDYRPKFIHEATHLPTTVFTSALKVNFGCYLGKRPFGISDNHYWGDNNVVYMNRLADVIYDPEKIIKMKLKNRNKPLGCNESQEHQLQPLIGLFNRPGISDTVAGTAGALCQLLINKNVFPDESLDLPPYDMNTVLKLKNAHQEVIAINGLINKDLGGSNFQRIEGYHIPDRYNQGGFLGKSHNYNLSWAMVNVGKCQPKSFYDNLELREMNYLMNYSNIGWPNEMANRFVSASIHLCQYGAADLFTFNATFAMAGVEFKRMFVLEDNITNYRMHKINKEDHITTNYRRHNSPLMLVAIITTNGLLYRVVLCDFHSALINSGVDKIDGKWYDWCLFRHTDQPYVYRQYTPLEFRPYGVALTFRASHLLHEKMLLDADDTEQYPPHSQRVKDIELMEEDKNKIIMVSLKRYYIHRIDMDCSSYDKCVTCASDPKCMWMYTRCMPYRENSSNGIQDVLDSGFKCVEVKYLKGVNNSTVKITMDKVMTFECSEHGYWNEKIIWKINGRKISSNNYIIIDETRYNLVIIQANKILKAQDTISCVGITDDRDKLYNGTEYDWILNKNIYSTILQTWYIFYEVKNCQEYSKCETCACDSKCTWTTSCITYNSNSSINGIRHTIDPRFKCVQSIANKNVDINLDPAMTFNCSQHGLWNNKIIWKINENEIRANNSIIIDKTHQILAIVKTDKIISVQDTISCIGIMGDGDKVYNGCDNNRSYIRNISSPVILNTWNITEKKKLCKDYDKCTTCSCDSKCLWNSSCVASKSSIEKVDPRHQCVQSKSNQTENVDLEWFKIFECNRNISSQNKIIWKIDGKIISQNNSIIIDPSRHRLIFLKTDKIMLNNFSISCFDVVELECGNFNDTGSFSNVLHTWNVIIKKSDTDIDCNLIWKVICGAIIGVLIGAVIVVCIFLFKNK